MIFDCDGVLLDSNRIKTEAFFRTVERFGKDYAEAFRRYHIENGGVSRYRKFEYFQRSILGRDEVDRAELDDMLNHYADFAWASLKSCASAARLSDLRSKFSSSRWFVVSGSDENELRRLLDERGMSVYFDGGIFGSPDNKDEILLRELSIGNIQQEAVFFGDSRYDRDAATRANIPFIYVSEWSELKTDMTPTPLKIERLSDLLE